MPSTKYSRLKWRALLTETLPYEVPVIFSNDLFYAARIDEVDDPEVRGWLLKVDALLKPGTNPYFYKIRKDRTGATDLAIVHPLWQLRLAEFYDSYSQSVLDYCRKSEFSLRKPTDVASVSTENPTDPHEKFKLGIPHVNPDDGEIDASRMASYFSYSRYNLLHRFFDSLEFLRLEKRFSRLRALDVTKCFFNIYTHTITWAVKERSFAKDNRNAYSFEAHFDSLMQRSNSNETNGIVVGPEISRIFAEIIFQEIDRKVFNRLNGMRHDRDYAIRRYVDDYLIFASSDSRLDEIESVIREELAAYKLFLNESKIKNYNRPFVTSISLARTEIAAALDRLSPLIGKLSEAKSDKNFRHEIRAVRESVGDIRLIVAKHQVGFHMISGWLLSILKAKLKDIITLSASGSVPDPEKLSDVLSAILQAVFYICALDLRVRTSYSLCQIIAMIRDADELSTGEHDEPLMQIISEEIRSLIRSVLVKKQQDQENDESVELYNLMICGAKYLGEQFTRSNTCGDALKIIFDASHPRYFAFITAKFCMMQDVDFFKGEIQALNDAVCDYVIQNGSKMGEDTEIFLMASDLVGSPDLDNTTRRKVLGAMVSGSISNAGLDKLKRYFGFTDWNGLRIEHTLARKELRPTYAWA